MSRRNAVNAGKWACNESISGMTEFLKALGETV
jgi:hypothetical protein